METEGDVDDNIRMLTRRLREKTIDVGVIGIGENAHIAFNDPPADFDTKQAYIIVNLDSRCKMCIRDSLCGGFCAKQGPHHRRLHGTHPCVCKDGGCGSELRGSGHRGILDVQCVWKTV